MEEQMTKIKLLEKIRSSRQELEDCLDQIPRESMTIPGAENDWSVKDILAHITAWEGNMRLWIQQLTEGETPDRPAPGQPWKDLDQINKDIFERNRNKSLDVVQAEFERSYRDTITLVASTSEKDLVDIGRFEWTGSAPAWYLVGGNTFWHYEEHLPSLKNWIDSPNHKS